MLRFGVYVLQKIAEKWRAVSFYITTIEKTNWTNRKNEMNIFDNPIDKIWEM